MREIKIKDIALTQGRPKIAVPITGRTHREIMSQVKAAKGKPCDILEWRADYYFGEIDNLEKELKNTKAHKKMIRILDDIDFETDGKPLIFTLRGHGYGGKVRISRENAYDLGSLAAQSTLVDMVDMELFNDDDTLSKEQVKAQIDEIHSFGVRTILSYHDYRNMPNQEQIENLTALMRSLGADIVKIAGTAKDKSDAAMLMKAAVELTAGDRDPVIFIAMGKPGLVTRVAGGKCGSCITFAVGDEPTADGQIAAEELKKLLDEYYGEE